mgnify:CR=1 FL=1
MAVYSGGKPVKTPTAKGLESLSKLIEEGGFNTTLSPAEVAAENTRVVDTTGVSSIDITEEGVFHVTMKSGDVSMPSIQTKTNPVIVPQGETQMNAPVQTTHTTTNATTTTEIVGNVTTAEATAAPVAPAAAVAPEATATATAAPVVESAISRLFSNESAWKEDAQSSLEVPMQVKNVRGRINMIEDVIFDHEKRINTLEKSKTSGGGHMTFSREKSWEDIGYNTASAVAVGVGAVTGVYLATKALNAIFGSEPATE